MKKFKKLLTIFAVFVMLFNTLTVSAATTKDFFDAEFYAQQYPDVVAIYGDSSDSLYQHYIDYGMSEGRALSPLFDVRSYRDRYSDLETAFGNDWSAYINHMLSYGLYEGRNTINNSFLGISSEQALSMYAEHLKAIYQKDGFTDNLAYFDVENYKNTYPDLQNAFGNNRIAYFEHYITYGIKEGRVSGTTVDPVTILNENPSVVLYANTFTPENISVTNNMLVAAANKTETTNSGIDAPNGVTPDVSTPTEPTPSNPSEPEEEDCEHSWDLDYTIDLYATCTEDGSQSIHCSLCGAKKDIQSIPATGHADRGDGYCLNGPHYVSGDGP